jgi:hypothetical protein
LKKIYLLLLLLASGGFFEANAQFGITVNGVHFSNGSTVEISCTSGPLQFIVTGYDATKNSDNYSFTYPSGWQVTSSPNDYNKTLQPDLTTGGAISFNRLRLWKNGILYDQTVYINIVRNTPNLLVTGDGIICQGQTKTYTLSGNQSGEQISWSTNLSGSSSSNSVQITANSNSQASYATANVTTANGCGTLSATKSVWAGPPSVSVMRVYGNTITPYVPYDVCLNDQYSMLGEVGGVTSASWSLSSNSSGASIYSSSLNGATVYSGSYQGTFVVQYTPFNTCGSIDRYYVFSANSCGYYAYAVSPNPASEEITILFEGEVESDGLPEQIDLFSESDYGGNDPVRTIDLRKESTKQQAKESRKITFDVKKLPKGTYILHITKEKEAKVESKRIILE